MNSEADLLAFLHSNLVDAGEDCVPYEMLSDEELAAIDGDHESAFLIRPWIEAQDDIDTGLAARFGERSLLLRGLLEVDRSGETPEIAVSDQLQFVADSRRNGRGYILARTSRNDDRWARNYALQSQIGGFEEEVDSEGFHLFCACTYAAVTRRLAAWALPGINHHGAELRTRVPADRWAAWVINEFGTDVTIGEINLFLPGPNGPTDEPETWLIAYAHGAGVVATQEGDAMLVAAVTASRLEARLAERIAQSVTR